MHDTHPDPLITTRTWLSRLSDTIATESAGTLAELFCNDAYWRDVLALTWNLETYENKRDIVENLAKFTAEVSLSELKIDESAPPPQYVSRIGRSCIEAFFLFTTSTGNCRGIVRLVMDKDEPVTWKAWTLLTALHELQEFPETVHDNRPIGQSYSRDFRGPNWLDKREQTRSFSDRDPTVLVVGGGQAGLSIAARLGQLGIDTLIIDRHERVGDNWRKRYHALTLHNQIYVNHLPYIPYPPSWPVYIPKDKLANWFEGYVEAMELNFWTGYELTAAEFDNDKGRWSATVRGTDGSLENITCRHIVMATGVSGIPNWPDLPGLDEFGGTLIHSSQYQDGEDWTGKTAVVIGTGNSGHDIAQDLASSGAEVTLVQRSSTLVVSIEPSAQLPYVLYDGSRPLEDTDLITLSIPMPLMKQAHIEHTRRSRELDTDLLEGLDNIGFKLDPHENHAGWQFKYLTRGGGYYFNVGCSDMLISGQIKLQQFSQIKTFTEHGLLLNDNHAISADLIVLATGYKPQEELIERLFGTDIQQKIGPIWGFGDQLELRNMYCRTPQSGLWFMQGSFAQCRINSRYLALQIKACEEGLLSDTKND